MGIFSSRLKMFGAALLALGLMVSFQNCAKAKFSAKPLSSVDPRGLLGHSDDDATGVITQTGGPNCRDELKQQTVPVKTIFVVDVSGSNKENDDGSPGTDVDKAVRGGSMQRFFNSYSSRANFAWSLITFSDSSARSYVSNSTAAPMQAALDNFMNIDDDGGTPYVPALDRAATTILNDGSRTSDTKYVVVFLSDGMPNPAVSDSTLTSKVNSILSAAPGQVSFNTVYYGGTNPDASQRLKMMAQVGAGNFLDTNVNPTGTAFLITDLILIPGVVCN